MNRSTNGSPMLFVPVTAMGLGLICGQALAQQCDWSPVGSGMGGIVCALESFDDGAGGGLALYAGGFFQAAGGEPALRIARRDPSAPGGWSPLGSGMNSTVWALTVFDDGTGPALFAGGGFTTAGGISSAGGVAKWDGQSWSVLGSGPGTTVRALAVFDDGTGPALYAGGGSSATNHIAKWDGQSWSTVGGGMDSTVFALIVFDEGGGEALYAAGQFGEAGGVPANNVARWDGQSWSPMGAGVSSIAYAFAVYDDGTGPALYVGGFFAGPGSKVARWDSAANAWMPLGSGIEGTQVWALTTYDDGSGEALYAGGNFHTAGGAPAARIARWDGSIWLPLGDGLGSHVRTLTVFDDGAGPALFAGGDFTTAGGAEANRVASWLCEQPCYANCDGSTMEPILTVDDFTCFINEFAAAQGLPLEQQIAHYANCDGSTVAPVLTVDDFTCFINEFAQGCP